MSNWKESFTVRQFGTKTNGVSPKNVAKGNNVTYVQILLLAEHTAKNNSNLLALVNLDMV